MASINTDNLTLTENGAVALKSSNSKVLDFFTKVNRDCAPTVFIQHFIESYKENPLLTLKVLLNMRDARDGKGEKNIPRILMFVLNILKPNIYTSLLKQFVKDIGCFKDLLFLMSLMKSYDHNHHNHQIEAEAKVFAAQLQEDFDALQNSTNEKPASISLVGKWAPSENSHYTKVSDVIRGEMGLTRKEYRCMLTKLRNKIKIIESHLSCERFELIDFSCIPAVAHRKLRTALARDVNAAGVKSEVRAELARRYKEYLSQLKRGDKTVKINFKGTQPHEIVNQYINNPLMEVDQTLESQFQAIIDDIKTKGSFKKTMAVVDVSGSMQGTPLEVAIALGLIVTSCTEGSFANKLITFHEKPSWFTLREGTLKDKVDQVKNMSWGGSTNIESVFDLLLTSAQTHNLTADQMVDTLFIFTDMQFDAACRTNKISEGWETTFETIANRYEEAGYKCPRIICWNLQSSDASTMPFTMDTKGVASLSGFSAELLKCVLDMNFDNITPYTMMMHVLEKYTPTVKDEDLDDKTIDLSSIDINLLLVAIDKIKPVKAYKGMKKQVEKEKEKEKDQVKQWTEWTDQDHSGWTESDSDNDDNDNNNNNKNKNNNNNILNQGCFDI